MIVLETDRLLLREPELNDLDAFCAMEMDPEVRRFVGGYPRTREEAERRFRNGRRHKTNLPFCSIILKAENSYIGRGGLHPMPGGAVGLGFYLARPYWGRGLATEAARSGATDNAIMDQTGHTDVRSVKRYIRRGRRFTDNVLNKIDL